MYNVLQDPTMMEAWFNLEDGRPVNLDLRKYLTSEKNAFYNYFVLLMECCGATIDSFLQSAVDCHGASFNGKVNFSMNQANESYYRKYILEEKGGKKVTGITQTTIRKARKLEQYIIKVNKQYVCIPPPFFGLCVHPMQKQCINYFFSTQVHQ